MPSTASHSLVIPCLGALLVACSAQGYSERAGRRADGLLVTRSDEALAGREETVKQPVEVVPPPETPALPEGEEAPLDAGTAEDETAEAAPRRVLNLRDSLAIAYESNRDLITIKEQVHIQALSLAGVRHAFSPQLELTLGYLFAEGSGGQYANSGDASFSLSQILPTGGDLRLSVASVGGAASGFDPTYSSGVAITLMQPLLRGAGYDVSHEPLIQAERDLIYTIRAFELFREDFSIDVAQRFYGLVRQKQSIDNQSRNLESNEFGRRQAEALFAVGRANELDVLRARRSELSARNAYLEAQESFEFSLDSFRIFLGLPPESPIDVLPDPPDFTPVRYDVASAVDAAFANRLDLLTRVEQVEDQTRVVAIARDGLLPDLNLQLTTGVTTEPSGQLGGGDPGRDGSSVQLALRLPVDRVRESNSYRASQIGLERARRDLDEFRENMRAEIERSFRELERRLESLDINRQLIDDQTKNLRIAEIRFERGDLPNRDVVEARQSLLDAQNDLINEQVNYEISRLRLLRNLGILFVDETGMWKL